MSQAVAARPADAAPPAAAARPAVGVRPAVRIEDDLLCIPADVGALESFRRWALSESFPETGRIDYLEGAIEVDMSPEDLQTHGTLKGALHLFVGRVVEASDRGQVFIDRARLSAPFAKLSCEPDLLFVSWDALESGRARFVPSSSRKRQKLMEIQGAVDLVVEVVSDSSVGKDTKRLPPLYARAGVQELWLADGRSERLSFRIYWLEGHEYRPAPADRSGYQRSRVLERRVRVRRRAGRLPGTWRYIVDEAPSVRRRRKR